MQAYLQEDVYWALYFLNGIYSLQISWPPLSLKHLILLFLTQSLLYVIWIYVYIFYWKRNRKQNIVIFLWKITVSISMWIIEMKNYHFWWRCYGNWFVDHYKLWGETSKVYLMSRHSDCGVIILIETTDNMMIYKIKSIMSVRTFKRPWPLNPDPWMTPDFIDSSFMKMVNLAKEIS